MAKTIVWRKNKKLSNNGVIWYEGTVDGYCVAIVFKTPDDKRFAREMKCYYEPLSSEEKQGTTWGYHKNEMLAFKKAQKVFDAFMEAMTEES